MSWERLMDAVADVQSAQNEFTAEWERMEEVPGGGRQGGGGE